MTDTTGMHSLGPEEVVGVFEKEPSTNMRRTRCIKAVVALALLSLLTYIIVDSLTAHRVGDAIVIFLEWVDVSRLIRSGVFLSSRSSIVPRQVSILSLSVQNFGMPYLALPVTHRIVLNHTLKGNKAVTIGIVVLGIVFAIAGVFLTSHFARKPFARKELNQIIEGRKAEIDQDSGNNLADAPAVERREAV